MYLFHIPQYTIHNRNVHCELGQLGKASSDWHETKKASLDYMSRRVAMSLAGTTLT